MKGIVNKAKSEVRALTEEEDTRFDEIKKEKKKEERSQEEINNEELRSIFKEEREATPAAYHTNTQSQLAMYVYTDSAFTRKGLIGYGADLYIDGTTKDDQQVVGIFNVVDKAA